MSEPPTNRKSQESIVRPLHKGGECAFVLRRQCLFCTSNMNDTFLVFQTDVSVGSWPNVAYTPKLSELAGVKWKGMNTSYQRFTSMMLKYWIDDNQSMLTQFEIFRSVVTARFATVS